MIMEIDLKINKKLDDVPNIKNYDNSREGIFLYFKHSDWAVLFDDLQHREVGVENLGWFTLHYGILEFFGKRYPHTERLL